MQQMRNMETNEVSEEFDPSCFFTGRFAEQINALTPSMRLLTEKELFDEIRVTPILWEMRRKFWMLIEKAREAGQTHIPTAHLYTNLCNQAYFTNEIMPNLLKIAWIIMPIPKHSNLCEELMRYQLANMREFLMATKITEKNLGNMLKLLEYLTNRSIGPVAQNIQIQSKNLNIETTMRELPPTGDNLDIAAKLERAKTKLLEAPRDVSPSSDENKE